jgi:hypothetical protein
MTQTIAINNGALIVNGEKIPFPRKHKRSHSIIQDGSRLFVDGYEWKNGGWKITARSVLSYLFG